MNIIQICPTPFPSLGGPALNYAQFHRALGTQTVCFIRPGEGHGEKMVVPTMISVRTIDFPLLTRYYYTEKSELLTAEKALAGADCIIIHNFYRFPAQWAAQTARAHGIPYILVLHGILDPWVFNKNGILKRMWLHFYGAKILHEAAAVLCATEREKEKVDSFLKHGVGRVVNWALEVPFLAKRPSNRAALRQKLGFADTDRVLVFLGRIDEMKRPLETVRLLAGIGDSRLKLLVVGPDANVTRRQLEKEARKLRWNGLHAIGPCFSEEKYDYLRAADAYISLSHRENFNFTAAEAMLCGLPLILSAGNDLGWEFLDHGFSWQLRTDDPGEAREAVAAFLKASPAELNIMGSKASHWATTHLSMKQFTERLTTVVHQCVARRRIESSRMPVQAS